MSESDTIATPPRPRRRFLPVIAGVLAITGLGLSYFQARRATTERIDEAKRYAHSLALIAHYRLERRLIPVLLSAAEHFASVEHRRPYQPDRSGPWLELAFVWDGSPGHPEEELLERASLALQAHLGQADPESLERGEIQYVDLAPTRYFLAYRIDVTSPPDTPITMIILNKWYMVTWIIPDRLLTMAGLEIAVDGGDGEERSWREPLGGGLDFWRIQPTLEADHRQTQAVVQQALLFGPVTVLSIMALIAMIGQMARVVKREKALSGMKSDFVANVSHELKTPLALIHLFGETLLEGRVPTEEKKNEYYRIILRESARLTHLIDNLLDFSRIEARRKEYDMIASPIAPVIEETYRSYVFELDHEKMEHKLTMEDDLPPVEMDRNAVAQVLLNLMSNAVKYSENDRFLWIQVEKDTRRGRRGVLLSVHDRGIGIPPDQRSRVFDGFFRVDDQKVRERRGTGLGLALVKHIVEAHGGSVSVESRLVKGTTFRIFLPAAPTAEDTTPTPQPAESAP